MRRGRVFIYLALILILGLVAVYIVWDQFLNQPPQDAATAEPTPAIEMVSILVVSQKIPRGTIIQEDMVSVQPIQRDLLLPGMMTDIVDVQGKLAKFDLESGIPLTSGMIVDSAEQLSAIGSIAALSIPRGLVAVSIPINRLSSVSYAPRPGDHVNVIVSIQLVDLDTDFQTILPNNAGVVIAPGVEGELGTNYLTVRIDRLGAGPEDIGKLGVVPGLDQPQYSVPSEKQRPRLVSQNLLQDAIVLGVGNFPLEDEEPEEAVPVVDEQTDEGQPPAEGEQPVETPAPVPPDVITLIVSPQDAITLNYLIFSGAQMTLALRPSEDDTRVQTDAVTLQYLLDTYSIPVPVRLPYGMEPRVDALGGATSKYEDVQPTPVP